METLTVQLPSYLRHYPVNFFEIEPREPLKLTPETLREFGFCPLENDLVSIQGLPSGVKVETEISSLADGIKRWVKWTLTEGEIPGGTDLKLLLGYPKRPGAGVMVPTLAISKDVYRSRPIEIELETGNSESTEAKPLFSLKIPVNIKPGAFDHFVITAPTLVEKGKSFTAVITARDEFDNVIGNNVPEITFSTESRSMGLPDRYQMKVEDRGIYQLTAKVEHDSVPVKICGTVLNNPVPFCSNPILTRWYPSLEHGTLLWGDLQSHSGISPDVSGTMDDLFEYAKEVSRLDFVAKSDHDGDLMMSSKDTIEKSEEITEKWNQPGKFTTFQAYEYTPKASWGHRVVLYRGNHLKVYPQFSEESNRPDKLWAKLEKMNALTIPHHPMPKGKQFQHQMDWSTINNDFQRLVEVYSQWTDQTFFGLGIEVETASNGVQDALAMGHKLGFVGGTDNHTGQPGKLGGLTAVYSDGNTRDSIFEALYNRRCYATTGARIVVWFEVNGAPMGSEITVNSMPKATPPKIKLDIVGTNPIESLEIVRYQDNEYQIVYKDSPGTSVVNLEWKDNDFKGPAFYYARLSQSDNHRAWASPVWLTPSK